MTHTDTLRALDEAPRRGSVIDSEHNAQSWIWNEGVPADIATFDGARVVLVGQSTYQRAWGATRVFPSMPGCLEPRGVLSPAEVTPLLTTLLARATESPAGSS